MLVELTKEEKIILDIVGEYLNKNRQFILEEIVPFINSRLRGSSLNLNYKGIKQILKSLLDKRYLIEGSKLSQEDILENEKRREIYEYVLNNPGVYFNRIVSNLGFSNHVVVWHLNMLLKFNFIKKIKVDNHDIYFDLRTTKEDAQFYYYTSKNKSKRIIDYLKNGVIGATKTELSSVLNIHINTLSKYLNKLQEFNVITSEEIDNKILYFFKLDL